MRTDGLTWRVVDGEVIVLDVPGRVYLAGNHTAALLWEALAEGARTDELVARVVDEFGIDPETASRDVDHFLEELRKRGLLDGP
ncbi:MAG TPA: PqqD family protein [Acidimicrobiales bacterium]|nr:PqqD family protein [Acidimicrobiales bacterium]